MNHEFHTVHDGRRTLDEGFADLIAAKQRAALVGRSSNPDVESSADVFDDVCMHVGRSLESDGFRFSSSKHKSSKRAGDHTYDLLFSSDLYNVAGVHVLLRISGLARSRRFKEWQKQEGFPNPSDIIAGGQIGYFSPDHLELIWELADRETRSAVTDGATAAIRQLALPWFSSFSNPSLTEQLIKGTVPGIGITGTLNFLMCFASRDVTKAAGQAFFERRPDLVSAYKQEFRQLKDRAPLRVHGQGYAKELAILSRFYDLGPLV